MLNRRQFTVTLAAAGGLAVAAPRTLFAEPGPTDTSPIKDRSPVAELYRCVVVIDGASEAFPTGPGAFPVEPKAIAAAVASGVTAINFTVVGPGTGFEETVAAIATVQRVAEANSDRYLVVRRPSDILRAKTSGALGLILGFQTTEMLGENLSRLPVFRGLGVRIVQLTYNARSLYGDGCLEPANAGLSNLGREAVASMNGLGIAVDVSHCGQRTTAEAIEVSKKPILISHAGCRAVFDNPRNKDDAALRALADKGGVIGIYLMPYLSAGPGPITVDDLLRHLDHAIGVCGEDHVGIGSDQGIIPIDDNPEYRRKLREEIEARRKAGVSAPGESAERPPFIPELNTPNRMEAIAAALEARGYKASAIEKILGANFHRVLSEIWGTT
ncbi:MAG: dipeptidase [Thermoanaerobaculales bacterium]